MELGIFTSGYQRSSLDDAFRDAKQFGYDYVELWGGRPHAYAPDLKAGDIEIIKKLIDKYKMPVKGYTPEHNGYPYNFMIGSEAMRQDAVAYLKLSLDMAKAMGAEFILISPAHGGYTATYKEIWDRLIKTMQELAEHAEKTGVNVVIETLTPLESNVCKNANDLAEIFSRVPSPRLKGMLDVVVPFIQHESITAYFDLLKDKLYHLHLVDSDGTTDSHVCPGEGVLPLRELVGEIRQRGYQGTATIELVTGYIHEPSFYSRRAIEHIRSLMK
ncbi:protein FrlC [Spirochaetia bacterium]|nr:protein FrlC [Spirochaetia bacterium]